MKVRDEESKRVYTEEEFTCRVDMIARLVELAGIHAPEEEVMEALMGVDDDWWCRSEEDARKLLVSIWDKEELEEREEVWDFEEWNNHPKVKECYEKLLEFSLTVLNAEIVEEK